MRLGEVAAVALCKIDGPPRKAKLSDAVGAVPGNSSVGP